MIRPERPLDLIEAAYRLDGSNHDWMDNVVRTMAMVFAREGYGAIGFTADGRVDDSGQTILSESDLHCIALCATALEDDVVNAIRAYPSFPAELQQRLFFSATLVGTTSAITGLGVSMPKTPMWRRSGLAVTSAQDAFGLTCHTGPLHSVVLSAPIRGITSLSRSQERLWERIAMHIAAGFRLRRTTSRIGDEADAVMSPGGELHHLRPDVDSNAVREGFSRRAHARASGTAPETALEVWQGLHDGRWSLVDWIDTDGKVFVVAARNEPARDLPSSLTDRQRSALALAALGYGNKQIAYALGLTAPAVAMLLARARAATGVRTRAELIRAFKRTLNTPEIAQ